MKVRDSASLEGRRRIVRWRFRVSRLQVQSLEDTVWGTEKQRTLSMSFLGDILSAVNYFCWPLVQWASEETVLPLGFRICAQPLPLTIVPILLQTSTT